MNRLNLISLAAAALVAAGGARPVDEAAPPTAVSTNAPSRPNPASGETSVATRPAPDLAVNPRAGGQRLDPALPAIFVAGDSTAARGSGANQRGWAVPFADYFDPTKVNVINRARGGRSSRTFITEGLWERMLAEVKPGDIVLIQFGHNDGGAINDASRARGSIRGLGEETEEIDNLVTGKHEVIHTFGWYLRKMIAETRAREATPIVLSLTVRNIWREDRIERGPGRYGQWSEESAKAAGVPFIDLTRLVADQLQPMGEEKVQLLYPRDHTHFNAEGADLHARMVVLGLKDLPARPVDGWLSAKGKAVGARPGFPSKP